MTINELTLNTNLFSMGSVLGTNGSEDLMRNINNQGGGGSFFSSDSDPFKTGFQNFLTTVVEPIRQVKHILKSTADKLFNKDVYRTIDSREELAKGIAPCMHLGIIYHPVIRKQLEEEKIDGFGIDPLTLQEEDPYEDVLTSGYAEIHSSNLNDKGELEMKYIESTVQPEMTREEIEHLRETRAFIDLFVNDPETRHYDFTNWPELHA